ncbi:hypothetical protein SAMN04489716_5716 [Actinoplanes derwentensis]|uniref:Uncharacterized protein n=1 Tax=Actinoplanes derwentensis TaxID=113562 RepID=A0A1H2CF40_9ACTN|nr:hypothetical protein Ade03nite_49980 [Actinoplanes derwentensis]SDT69071.1 hypothetical protein SAMN04489716_5716 [Actinoplanes derwentensis]
MLLRSLPVLFALLLAFFAPTFDRTAPPTTSPEATFSSSSAAAFSAGSDAAVPAVSSDDATLAVGSGAVAFLAGSDVTVGVAELAGRTAAVSSPVATGPAVADRLAVTGAGVTVHALTSQFTAGAAASRAPPATA